ncbi:MAG: putative toxin-antitoxin system toxin component, PIN family [Thermoproteota archaeon]
MKVVPDTNILVSAIFWKGNESRIIELTEEGKLTLVTSLPILEELKRVLSYQKFALNEEKVNEYVEYYFFLAGLVSPTQKVNLIQNDPSDNKVLECAQEGEVDCIVSGDQHLLDLKKFKGIEIVKGEELLEILNTEA